MIKRFTVCLFQCGFVTIAVVPHLVSAWDRKDPSPVSDGATKSRRQLLVTSSACLSSMLLPSIVHGSAREDDFSMLNRITGSGGILDPPVIDSADGWILPTLSTKLGSSRIGTIFLSSLKQPLLAIRPKEVYYPSFLFGTWNVTATLQQITFPFGRDVVPQSSSSVWDGSPLNRNDHVGDKVLYQLHYFSTLADTPANQWTVNLGLGIPQPKVIADRAYNLISMNKAYQKQLLVPMDVVEWDYRNDPTQLTLLQRAMPSMMTDDDSLRTVMEQQRRREVHFTGRQSEEVYDENTGQTVFCSSERSRTVSIGRRGSVDTNDEEEVITEYRFINDNLVTAVSRIALYDLTPHPNSSNVWQQVSGKAVALYDYELVMKRQLEEFFLGETKILRPCVKTPKDIIQCA